MPESQPLRIATYNLWNSPENWPQRLAAAAEELSSLDADVVALQEAPVDAADGLPLAEYLRQQTRYPHVLHLPYPGPADKREWREGLAFLSQLPLRDTFTNWYGDQNTENCWAVRVVFQWQGVAFGLTNVHLDWRHAASRERHIVKIVREVIDPDNVDVDLDILCGDFNDDGDAPILQYLEGQTELHGHRLRKTRWHDLVAEWHAARGEQPPVTLDFKQNPRWKPKQIAAPSKRFDRIYARAYGDRVSPRVVRAGLFGKAPTNSLGLVPSDHYGVFVDLSIGVEPVGGGQPRFRGVRPAFPPPGPNALRALPEPENAGQPAPEQADQQPRQPDGHAHSTAREQQHHRPGERQRDRELRQRSLEDGGRAAAPP